MGCRWRHGRMVLPGSFDGRILTGALAEDGECHAGAYPARLPLPAGSGNRKWDGKTDGLTVTSALQGAEVFLLTGGRLLP